MHGQANCCTFRTRTVQFYSAAAAASHRTINLNFHFRCQTKLARIWRKECVLELRSNWKCTKKAQNLLGDVGLGVTRVFVCQ